jgi:hypothetical protein
MSGMKKEVIRKSPAFTASRRQPQLSNVEM